MSAVSRLYPLSLLAGLVLAGCSSQPSQPLKKRRETGRCRERGTPENAGQREGSGQLGAGYRQNL